METIFVGLVDGIVAPVTGTIPFLATSGILLLVFAGLWVAFAVAVVRDGSGLDRAWERIRGWPLVIQGVAWLLFLPVLAGLWVWRRRWPMVARLTVIGGVAGWNILIFMPVAA